MMTLGDKRQLSAAVKRLHGDAWSSVLRPIYDERQLASLKITRFGDADAITEIVRHPTYWLEIELPKGSNINEIREAIPLLVQGTRQHLEFLQIDYIYDVTARNNTALREALPQSGSFLANLPKIDRVVFNRVNLSDEHIKALCKNPNLTNVDVRYGDVTKRAITSLKKCKKLEFLILEKCKEIPKTLEDRFRSTLSHVPILRIK